MGYNFKVVDLLKKLQIVVCVFDLLQLMKFDVSTLLLLIVVNLLDLHWIVAVLLIVAVVAIGVVVLLLFECCSLCVVGVDIVATVEYWMCCNS